jgi:SRSO17 transposase
MTAEQIKALGPALADYLDQFLFCCGYTQTFHLLGVYCRGLLSDLPRKSVEPIALAAGVAVRTLQEFLRDHLWDHGQVRDLLGGHLADSLSGRADDGLGTIGIIDETGHPKKGTKTPGVQRQWCGRLGKQENCIVTVHLGVAKGLYKTLLDADLYLPQSWADDRPRCRAAGIPDSLLYRPKWRIALEQLDRAKQHGLTFSWLTFDEEYGKVPQFLAGLDGRQERFVGEVPRSFSCTAGRPAPGQEVKGQRADEVVRQTQAFVGQSWRRVKLPRQTLASVDWQFKAAQVWAVSDGSASVRSYWLIWASNEVTGEEKYFLSNAPPQASVRTLLRVGFSRWNVEHALRLSKSEVGLSHYEGRNYIGLMRHLTLCLLMLTFAADQAERLRGEKSGGHRRAGLPGAERPQQRLAAGVARHGSLGVHSGHHPVSPAPEQGRPRITAEETQQTPGLQPVAL